MGPVLRVMLSTAVAIGVAIGTAVAVAIADLYVTGHGAPSMNRPIINLPRAGIVLGIGDSAMLVATCGAWIATWRLLRPRAGS